MRGKTVQLLKKYASITQTPFKEIREKFKSTPRNERGKIKENMRVIIRRWEERVKAHGQ